MNIAILTNFMDMHPGYSLTGIVTDQAIMLNRHGHDVHVFCCEQYNPQYDEDIPAEKHKVIPFGHLRDYISAKQLTPDHKEFSGKIANVLIEKFREFEIDIAISHDWVFTGWNLPYAVAIRKVSPQLPKVRWFHWIHSVPSVNRDWWQGKAYGRNHRIIFPNKTERTRVSEQFQCSPEEIRIIPHIKDLRTWFDFDEETNRFIDDHPNVMQADFVQIYPASTDRLSAKRVDSVIGIFGQLKKRGFNVCLVIANQWATGRDRKEDVRTYYNIAQTANLVRDEEFIFTSEWDEQYDTGIPRVMLRELQLCSNLFIFPTREESFGLVGPEAALSGLFMGLNRSLNMMYEVFGNEGLYFDFGSHHNNFEPPDVQAYHRDLATLILGRFFENESLMTRTFCRKKYNMDNLYLNYYEPLFSESELWI